MKQESIRELTQQARRGSFVARRAPIILALVALLAGWTAHDAVRLTDWRSSVAAAHAGARSQDREERQRSVVTLHNAACEIIGSLKAARDSGDAEAHRRATDALHHITNAAR